MASNVSYLNRFSKVYRVIVQADEKYRLDMESLNNVFVRTNSGEMAPVSPVRHADQTYGSDVLNRFNLYNSIAVTGSSNDGYSSGDAIKAIKETAAEVLPRGYGYDFDSLTREENATGSNSIIIFGICILLIYLILCALYESFFVPFAVILAVPCGLMGAFLLAKAMGHGEQHLPPDGYHHADRPVVEDGHPDYGVRRRPPPCGHEPRAGRRLGRQGTSPPILMTVLTCVIGMLPLMFSTGAGANGNSTLGTGVVGGMIVGTLALLFLVPGLFIAFQTLQEKFKPIEFDTDPQWAVRAEVERLKTRKRRSNTMRKTIIILAAAAMTGCGIYKPYTRPEVMTDGLYGTAETADSTTLGDLSWQEMFTDPQLQRSSNRPWRAIPTCNRPVGASRGRGDAQIDAPAYLPSFNFAPQGSLSSFDGATPTKTYSHPGSGKLADRHLQRSDERQA